MPTVVIWAILAKQFGQNIRHFAVGVKSEVLQENVEVLLKRVFTAQERDGSKLT